MNYQDFVKQIQKNPFGEHSVPMFTKDAKERMNLNPTDSLWNASLIPLTPTRLTTAWRLSEDPLMRIAGEGYRQSEVREKTFELQQEAMKGMRGNRKITKAKLADALSSVKPNEDQTKIIAAALYAMKQIQTICVDPVKKSVWTIPEDLRAWSSSYQTLWVTADCGSMLEWVEGETPKLSQWISDREAEGWTIAWPLAEGTLETLKALGEEAGIHPRPAELGGKVKKEDWAKSVGRMEAVRHLVGLFS